MIHRSAVGVAMAGVMVLGVPGTLSSASATTTSGDTARAVGVGQVAVTEVPERYLKQKLKWEECSAQNSEVQCARMKVPRDWKNPDAGVDLSIAVSRAEPEGGRKKDTRFVVGNPGGPGLRASKCPTS